MSNKLKYLTGKNVIIVLAIYVILVTVLSLVKIESAPTVPLFTNIDKVVHFTFYYGISFLAALIVRLTSDTGLRNIKYVLVVVFSSLYGFMIEVLQSYVGRDYDLLDVLANCTGSIFGVLTIYIYGLLRVR